jgi:uncharacterized RDD family membrane protein YckC
MEGSPEVGLPIETAGPGEPAEPAVEYSGAVTRLIAITLDALVINAIALAVAGAVLMVFSVFTVTGRNHPVAIVLGGAAYLVWAVSYFGMFWTTTGQTPGSRVMQIRVTRADGGRLRPRHALLRLVGMVISLPLFWGYVPVLTNPRRRGVPDMIAGTIVTHAPPRPEREAVQPIAGRVVPPA